MTIHTFGDSHCYFGFDQIPNVKTHHIGPVLCYSFNINRLNIKQFDVQENDVVIFSFGEIDCRCHIKKHVTQNRPYTVIIDEIVNNYFEAIRQNVKQFNKLTVCVYNVVPPVRKSTTKENKQYPFVGCDHERKTYALYFNKKLKQYCEKTGYLFIDIFNKYSDSEGFILPSLSDGHVHIKNPIYLNNFLKELKL